MAPGTQLQGGPFRVMVVDDSAVIRGLVARWLDADPDITVVYTAGDGNSAVRNIRKSRAELVVLDIEMPRLDGMSALPLLIEEVPGIKVIMSSTLTRRNADVTLRALAKGAVDYIPKPESTRVGGAAEDFKRELLEKIKTHGAGLRDRGAAPAVKTTLAGEVPARSKVADKAERTGGLYADHPIELRKPSLVVPKILAVGSSTGGPQALLKVFEALKGELRVPVVVTQHMPATFTQILSEHVSHASGFEAKEGTDGEELRPGRIYIAPGDYHMKVQSLRDGHIIRLNQEPPINFCRPAVDVLFNSVAKNFGSATLSLVLTGMGHDGLDGGRALVEAGGTLIAQDEATSVVWGMPGAVASEGLCSEVKPLSEIGRTLSSYLSGARA